MTHKNWSSRPWVSQLTNAGLIDGLGAADDARQHRGDAGASEGGTLVVHSNIPINPQPALMGTEG
jgi:hypothetical protein